MIFSKKFQKKTENFYCENCKFKNIGDGFTNHCSQCFYSKHVDIFPGDRLEQCGSLMEPIEVNIKKGKYIISNQCLKCNKISKNKFNSKKDNFDNLIKIIKKINEKK
ncbi:MAG: RNHCP domain-containing protein [Candidatus Pacebacteria bacterium]|nr:RNHCP domain-containing protein [Candidatus Paceibacterota bacterium]